MAQYRIPSDYQNDVSRSVHRWKSPVCGTFHPGLAYPVKWYHLDVGDRLRGKPEFLIQSQPMLGPLLQGFKFVTIATFTPDSVLYGWLSSGVRYSPQQIMNFDHFLFNPCREDDQRTRTADSKRVFTFLYPRPDGVTATEYIYSLGLGLGSHSISGISIDSSYLGSENYTDYRFHIGRGSLWDWLGVAAGAVAPKIVPGSSDNPPEGYIIPDSFSWRVEPLVSYFLSVYYYIANMQEKYMYFTSGGYGNLYSSYPFLEVFRPFDPGKVLTFLEQTRVDSMSSGYNSDFFATLNYGGQTDNGLVAMAYRGVYAHGGLLAVPYNPDLFNNIIKLGESPTAYIPVIDNASGDQVAVPRLRIQTKIQSMMDRLFVSGGRLSDVFRTLWGKKTNCHSNKPGFLGIWQSSINPTNVVATSNGVADGESANIGQMAARIDRFSDFSRHSGVDFTANEPGTVMFISFLVPDVSYSQGLDPRLSGASFSDDFNPEMNGIGFVSVPRSRYSIQYREPVSYAGVDPNSVAVGDSVAWDYYKTDFPRLHGELSSFGVFSYWALQRRFTQFVTNTPSSATEVYDNFSTYINPLSWQYIFASQSIFDPNFILYANLDFTVTNQVQSSYMPYMGK